MQRRYRDMGFNMPGRGPDPEYLKGTVGVGEYTVVLCVGDKKIRKTARVLKDHWAE